MGHSPDAFLVCQRRVKILLLSLGLVLQMTTGTTVHGQEAGFTKLTGPYLGQTPPGMTARLFAPGMISGGNFEHSTPVFTPDLTEVYWSTIIEENGRDKERPILCMKLINGYWTVPEVPKFARKFGCSESPCLTMDGHRLYFHASPTLRPETADMYYAEREGSSWSDPVKVGPTVNKWSWNGGPSVSSNGTLYFVSSNDREMSLFSAKPSGGGFAEREPLVFFNGYQAAFSPFISPDESYFIFCSFKAGGYGSGDLYISFRQKDGSWGEPRNMGDKINSQANERFPNVSPDGKYLFFNSTRKIPGADANSAGNGQGDVYWIDARIIGELAR